MTNEQLAEHMGILIQSLRSDMTKRLDKMDARFEQINARFEQTDARLDRIEKKLDGAAA